MSSQKLRPRWSVWLVSVHSARKLRDVERNRKMHVLPWRIRSRSRPVLRMRERNEMFAKNKQPTTTYKQLEY